jgi:hypothetical protein
MPRPDLSDITIVLDRSGSMSSVAADTIGGFNRFVADQKAAPGEARLTLVQFDNIYEPVHRGVPIREVPDLTGETFVPRGGTALLDAIGRAIGETGSRLGAMAESDRPGKVFFVVLTDGEENSSREFTRDRINEMIARQRDVYSWQFVFLGANQDAISAAASIGIPTANSMTYAHNAVGTADAFAALSWGTHVNRAAPGGVAVAFFNADDRAAQEKHGAPRSPKARPVH